MSEFVKFDVGPNGTETVYIHKDAVAYVFETKGETGCRVGLRGETSNHYNVNLTAVEVLKMLEDM